MKTTLKSSPNSRTIMTSRCLLVTIRFPASSQYYGLNMPFEMLSKHVAQAGILYACTPYTKGTETVFLELAYHLLADLRAAERGNTSTKTVQELKRCMYRASLDLEAQDIERVMYTVRNLLKDEVWDKAKSRFLKFIEEDYCNDLFKKVCEPVTQIYSSLLEDDLFTGYQYVSARGSDIANTIKDVVLKRDVNVNEILSDMCFLQYYVNERPFNTVDRFLQGYIITSFCSIYCSTL